MNDFSRRSVLAGLMASAAGLAAGCASADAPARSQRPQMRGGAQPVSAQVAGGASVPGVQALIDAAKLGGAVAFVVADAQTGQILEGVDPHQPLAPASTAKTITSLYALETLGGDYRFNTRLIATGPVQGGVLQGDLVLAGGGDPTLNTDDLGAMVAELKARGVSRVAGRFLVWGGALPYTRAIDDSQADYLGYNPAVSGIILNYNRVNFVWQRRGNTYETFMDARGGRYAPRVTSADVTLARRDLPVYTYSDRGGQESWTVAMTALGNGGSRWLPVRRPEAYAGNVFRTLATAQGVSLPAADVTRSLPAGDVLVSHSSVALRDVLRDMLKYSNNLTAEVVGMTASMRQGGIGRHEDSGPLMTAWLQARTGITEARFVDHSGLGAASRISPAAMMGAIATLGPRYGLRELLKSFAMRDEDGDLIRNPAIRVDAKTGTLNFVSTLTGWETTPSGKDLVFAIFTGDVARRDAVPEAQRERPPGGREWVRRSKRLQQQLIERWAVLYG